MSRASSLLFLVPSFALTLSLASGCSCESLPVSGRCTARTDCPVGFDCIDRRCIEVGGPEGGLPDGGLQDTGPPVDGGPPREACTVPPSPTPFDAPALELHWRGAGLPFPALEQAIHSPIVIDFLEDGPDELVPELIFVSYDGLREGGVLRVVSGRPPYETRMTLAGDGTGPVTDDTMATPMLLSDGHPAAGDVDGDGQPDVVALLLGGGAVAFDREGREIWRISAMDLPTAEIYPNGSIALADLDQDGDTEVIIGRVAIDGRTGMVLWTGTGGRGLNNQGPLSCVADVAPTPGLEVIAGRTVYDANGAIVWTATDAGDGFCAIADVTDASGGQVRDGLPEVIRVADGAVYVHDGATGELRYMRALPSCMSETGRGGAPTVADFDGDGFAEIGVAGSFCYSVIDFGCIGAGRPAECAGNGLLWRATTEDNSSNVTSSTVFDFNGDGSAEVVYNDEQYFLVFDGRDGTELYRQPNPSRTRTEQPIVADVDADGNAEILFTANTEAAFAGDSIPMAERIPGVEIWSSGDDSWVGARSIWNQHTYHIDNIDELGGIPRVEAPSWMGHNSYRQNFANGDLRAAPDLVGEVASFDTSRCGEGILIVCATIRNEGDVRVGPGLVVSFYDGDPDAGGTLIGSAPTTIDLSPGPGGSSERVCVEWPMAPTEPRRVYARVDSEGGARECIEDNNTVSLGEARCMTVM